MTTEITNTNRSYGLKIAKLLQQWRPAAACELGFATPFELLVATILSAQCTDVRVNLVTKSLFVKYRNCQSYLDVSAEELEQDIHSTGFYKNKAKNIRGMCWMLIDRHGGEVPADMDSLVELPGVGRKTANVVLGSAFGITSGIVVDTHVTRLSHRLGLSSQKSPEKIEDDLMQVIPKKQWIDFSHQMVHLGRYVCTARKPQCNECPLRELCPQLL